MSCWRTGLASTGWPVAQTSTRSGGGAAPPPPRSGRDWAGEAPPREPVVLEATAGDVPRIAMLDTGVKLSIVRKLRERGATVELHPCAANARELMQSGPDAIFLANGPGDPAALGYIVETVRELGRKRPDYGLRLGHHLLCRAVGLGP